MFNIGEKVRMNTYAKELKIFAHIIDKRIVKDRVAYVVKFRNGKVGTYFENEIIKIK